MTTSTRSPLSANVMSLIFTALIAGAILCAAATETMPAVTKASFDSAKAAVQLALNLIGIMALWLGLVHILEVGGAMHRLALLIKPVMTRLFPDVPADHPAMGAMLLNIAANMLGLGNAATPFGLKAMTELERLNPHKGTATNAMCLFLAINTSSVTLLPLGVIGVRAAAGATAPAHIFLPSLLATLCSTLVAVCTASFFAMRDKAYSTSLPTDARSTPLATQDEQCDEEEKGQTSLLQTPHLFQQLLGIVFLSGLVGIFFWKLAHSPTPLTFLYDEALTTWLMPVLMLAILAYGLIRGVRVYETVTTGAKQGFDIAIKIIPFLVSILVAIGMFRASGAMGFLIEVLSPLTLAIGMPAEVLPMALVRPLSGTGAFGVMSALVQEAPDSYAAFVASTMQGSTETTFYVLAVYFGAAGITKVRHALAAALLADATGIAASLIFCSLLW